MEQAIFSIGEEKRKKIINAAMKEFTNHGYKNASTNQIVRDAGISKGSLFHYFESKKGLAEFLIQYNLDVYSRMILNHMEDMTDDIIERWRDIIFLKITLIGEYPLLFEFMLQMLSDDAEEVQSFMKAVQENFIEEFKRRLYDNIDFSRFRKDVDIDRALKLIFWGLEGYAKEVQAKVTDGVITDDLIQQALSESNQYLELFKGAFYEQAEVAYD